MIIDAHVHVAPSADRLGVKHDASVERFLSAFDASPLDAAVLLPIEPIIPTKFTLEVASRRPGRLYSFASVDPRTGFACVRELERLAAETPVRGLKLHPRRQGITRGDLPVLRALARTAGALNLPVLVDAFPYGRGALRDDSLELIEALADAAPSTNLIIAHMGGTRLLDALTLARTSYSIYLDISLTYAVFRTSHLAADVFYAMRRIGASRCLYGSDHPDVELAKAYEDMREALDAHRFSSDEQDWIFGKTASMLLGLGKERFP